MSGNLWSIPLQTTNFNIVVAFLGGFISIFGLVSYLLKENYYLSEARVAFGPHGADFIRPRDYAECAEFPESCDFDLNAITLNFSRLVLGVQLVLAGVQLPSKYLVREWKSLSLLLGPGMTCMWLATSLLVWALAGQPPFLHALAIGACVTPTDPVLSAVIVKGKFADHNIPQDLQYLITAESGANDGLGYPFLFLALYLIKFTGAAATSGGAADAMGLWFGMTWGYTIFLSVIYGAVVGWLSRLRDRPSTLRPRDMRYGRYRRCPSLFIAGNTFTWDDWFRLETKDDSLQPTIDMLLNVTIFLWYGAYIPWKDFHDNSVIPLWHLVILGICVLVLRRLPWVFGMHKWIHQIEEVKQAVFVGFFGPIGVSAVFYLFISLEFIEAHLSDEDGRPRSDVKNLGDQTRIIVWFLTVCSIVVHGLSIPVGKLGFHAPRTLSRVVSESLSDAPTGGRRRNIPFIGRYFFGPDKKDARPATGPIVITGAQRMRSELPVHAGDETPPIRREIQFADEVR
ncbi:Cation/H exchanger [Fusarium oxysporum f. sp. vasinfectum]|nr:Cation/H exchanger [Fusarium oxysporum f. sp. vasinfectum]